MPASVWTSVYVYTRAHEPIYACPASKFPTCSSQMTTCGASDVFLARRAGVAAVVVVVVVVSARTVTFLCVMFVTVRPALVTVPCWRGQATLARRRGRQQMKTNIYLRIRVFLGWVRLFTFLSYVFSLNFVRFFHFISTDPKHLCAYTVITG